jgi:hypothetical protein
MKIALSLPGALRSLFVVAVERMPCPVEALLPWRVTPPHRRAVTARLGTPSLMVTHHRAPWRQPADLALTRDERHLIRRARQHIVVGCTAPPRALPALVQAARATARALARAGDGLVADPLTGATVPLCGKCPDEPPEFRLADDWLGWDIEGHRVTSRGLRRFALPEITIDGALCAHTLCATGLLHTVADRLLAGHLAFLAAHPHATVRLIDDHLLLDAAASSPFRGAPPLGIRLIPCDDETTPGHPDLRDRIPAPGRPDLADRTPAPGRPEPADRTPAPGEPVPAVGHLRPMRRDDVRPLTRPGLIRRLKVAPVPGTGQVACLKAAPPSGPLGVSAPCEPGRAPLAA